MGIHICYPKTSQCPWLVRPWTLGENIPLPLPQASITSDCILNTYSLLIEKYRYYPSSKKLPFTAVRDYWRKSQLWQQRMTDLGLTTLIGTLSLFSAQIWFLKIVLMICFPSNYHSHLEKESFEFSHCYQNEKFQIFSNFLKNMPELQWQHW